MPFTLIHNIHFLAENVPTTFAQTIPTIANIPAHIIVKHSPIMNVPASRQQQEDSILMRHLQIINDVDTILTISSI